ncbi:MAG: GNAT family N-acetyltransferase [Bdellovibrionales bacterium]|nr:GNAT family N-acetyltransferase [Bdellovibrionales bacterium]
MTFLKPMTVETFERFKQISQSAYAASLASVEDIPLEVAARYASEQFDKLVPNGTDTSGQSFFDVLEKNFDKPVGNLWLGTQNRFGRKVVSINDITIKSTYRGRGLGKSLMKLVEKESRKIGASRIRLHVFHSNKVAKSLYLSMGFVPTNLDMRKEL